MPGWFARLAAHLTKRRQRRKDAALHFIKARYHIFRVLLSYNERALEALAELDRLVSENETSRAPDVAATLYETALELADGVNRLTESAHLGLYPLIEGLRRKLDEAIARYQITPRGLWLSLAEITPDAREQAGGKAEPLGRLLRAGLPIPEGVIVTRRACREYLRQAHLEDRLKAILRQAARPEQLDPADLVDLPDLAAKAQDMILASSPTAAFGLELRAVWDFLAGGRPLSISVRSSASGEDGRERSFAGQYESVLGVRDPDSFIQAFKTVLASAFSERALAYRSGALGESLDMAVLCQRMVEATASGVMFTVDPMNPESERMLITAVPGLGTQAVSGRAPADIYRPGRGLDPLETAGCPSEIAEKTIREVAAESGGLRLEEVTGPERSLPLLTPAEIETLRGLALRIEALSGGAQDIEWARNGSGVIWILQARPARLARPAPSGNRPLGRVLLAGGAGASPGKAAGRLILVRSREDLAMAAAAAMAPAGGPLVIALHQSLVDAASLVPQAAALLVDMGNPLDHLACLSRELGIPMITGLGTATTALSPGQWVLADADAGLVLATDERLWQDAPRRTARPPARLGDAAAAVRKVALPLNLTDAYGPTFSMAQCESLHDVVRFIHEKAVLALFAAEDALAGEAFALVHRLHGATGLSFLIIDLGGGLAPSRAVAIPLESVLCDPLAALCRGMATPGLRWGKPSPAPITAGLIPRSLPDKRGERPSGESNYALVTRDYVNLNARFDYHFAMIDAVCGANPRENAIRFRFKGGGASQVQRERRAAFIEAVMRNQEFFTNRQGDMVTAVLAEGVRETVRAKIEMLGRLLGFSRLLDAAMIDESMPGRLAAAFLEGDYSLDGLAEEMASQAQA
jgi:pyruvate,water dikinase